MVMGFGQSFEELVKDYLLISKNFKFVTVGHLYQFPKSTKIARKQKYPSDIDVMGIRKVNNNGEIWLIECQEAIRAKDIKKFNNRFNRIIPDIKKEFPEYKIRKVLACFDINSNAYKKLKKAHKYEILFFVEMLEKIAKKIDRKSDFVIGKYQWLLLKMKKADFNLSIITRKKQSGKIILLRNVKHDS